jgi:hypothetical protein
MAKIIALHPFSAVPVIWYPFCYLYIHIQSFEKTLSLTGYATTRLAGTGVWVKITEAINF